MADGFTFDDAGELDKLARDLEASTKLITTSSAAIVTKGAQAIKTEWAAKWAGHPRYKSLPDAISYDVNVGLIQTSAEIGPDKGRRQGALGNIVEFGTSKNAPNPGGGPALAAEGPKFEQALAEAAGKVLDK